MNILLATQNSHKIQEISSILSHFSSINIHTPEFNLDIIENKTSYIENALIKAKAWAKHYPDYYILADDSGLEVAVLNNAPGVISAEYAGKNVASQEHTDKLLKELHTITQREACFVAYILLLSPQGEIFVSRGECRGRIAEKSLGQDGFGYDPIFLPVDHDYKFSFSQLSEEQKNSISHRYKALIGLKDYLTYLEV